MHSLINSDGASVRLAGPSPDRKVHHESYSAAQRRQSVKCCSQDSRSDFDAVCSIISIMIAGATCLIFSRLLPKGRNRTRKNTRWTKKLWFADDKEGRPEKRMGEVFPKADCGALQSHGFGCSFKPITIEMAHQRSSRLVMDWPEAQQQ